MAAPVSVSLTIQTFYDVGEIDFLSRKSGIHFVFSSWTSGRLVQEVHDHTIRNFL